MNKETKAVILMGVSGCGKSSVGKMLSEETGWPFYDGDDFHPEANVAKMAEGIPLNDADRQPWLESLHQLIKSSLRQERPLIVACSALKKSYRDILRGDLADQVVFIHLKGSFRLIYTRMQQRDDHYMKAEMLRSQYETLQKPRNAIEINIDKSVPEITQQIIWLLNMKDENG
jgi:carbohydrate kinase (thermoresistant glucokinase family)